MAITTGRASVRVGLLLVAPALVFLLVFYVVPLGYMVEESLHPWQSDGGNPATFSVEQYETLAKGGRTLRAFERTLRISALSTAITLALAYPIALMLLWAGRRLRTAVLVIVFLSLASPEKRRRQPPAGTTARSAGGDQRTRRSRPHPSARSRADRLPYP